MNITYLTRENIELFKPYREIWAIVNKSYSQKAHKALVLLQDYVNGAILEYSRYTNEKEASVFGRKKEKITKALKESNRPATLKIIKSEPTDWLQILPIYLDVHFFLICADKVQNLVQYIAEADGDPNLVKLAESVEIEFKPFNEARNHFEHIDNEIKNQSDDMGLSSTDGEFFRFRIGKKWQDINMNESTLKLIRDTYEKLLAIFRTRPDRIGNWRE